MPERNGDPNAFWTYVAEYPGADFKKNQVAIQSPELVESTGVDGRFLGAIRPFPGMADVTVHGVPKPEAGQTITSISNIIYAKYVAIQKGATRHTLKGIAYLADNPGATGTSLYFAYRDSQSGTDDVVELEDFKSWDDFTLDSLSEFDITSNGKYIYFVCSGTTSSTPLTKFNTQEPPYNKAYFFDWKINDWDAFDRNGTGIENRFMGLLPTRLLLGALNEDLQPEIVRGTAGATTAASTTIDLTGDTPDLSNVAASDLILLRGQTGAVTWTETLDILTVNDGADTLTVTVAPLLSATGVTWTIVDDVALLSDATFHMVTDNPTGFKMPKGNYTGAVELISRKHGLRSYIRLNNEYALGTAGSSIAYVIDNIHLPVQADGAGGQNNQLRGAAVDTTCLLYWGIPHVDGYRFWRSQGDAAAAAGDEDKYTTINFLFLVNEYLPKTAYQPTSAGLEDDFDHKGNTATARGIFGSSGSTQYFKDDGLITQQQYDALDEAFGAMPRAKLITNYAGLIVGVTDIAEPSALTDNDWDTADQRTEEIFWSHTGKLEPENFPPENRYPPDDPSEKFLALEVAGDHCYAISSASVYKFSRSGSTVALNRILSRLGGVSRFAATGVGNVLFVVTKAGVKSIDGNTGAVKSISAMDRIIMDDGEWAQSLSSIHLQYDATMGVLVFLNTSTNECFLLWEATGAVSRLVDCPWVFLAGGNDVLSNGSQRAYFIESDGTVVSIDGARQMGKRSMCGTGALETVNGTVTTASTTKLTDTAATFPLNCVNHQVYFHNGALDGSKATITARDSATVLSISTLASSTIIAATGVDATRYSIAPVVTELVFPQLDGEGGLDPFSRKVTSAMSVAFSDLGGETASTDTNPFVRMGFWRNRQRLTEVETAIDLLPDQCVARVNIGDVRVYPSLRFLGGNIDFELQSVLIHGMIGASEAQSRQV